ncbi:MAG: hypothetical protein ACRCUY_01840 [Thermoguttaceae bacterium]
MREKNSNHSIKAGKEVRSTALTVYFSHRGTEDTEKREQILCEPCVSVREKNSSRSITAGKEVRSTALTVYFSHRGTEDTEKRKQILREPCASVREKIPAVQ